MAEGSAAATKPHNGTIREWSIEYIPYMKMCRVRGRVYGNSFFYDGEPITTSWIVKIECDQDGIPRRIETRSSIYDLGEASEK